jgi:hypothetical protein
MKLVSDDKALLAMEESNATCDKRFGARPSDHAAPRHRVE